MHAVGVTVSAGTSADWEKAACGLLDLCVGKPTILRLVVVLVGFCHRNLVRLDGRRRGCCPITNLAVHNLLDTRHSRAGLLGFCPSRGRGRYRGTKGQLGGNVGANVGRGAVTSACVCPSAT